MIQTVEEMIALVDIEMSKITDPIVYTAIRSLLVPTVKHYRTWWNVESVICWSILEDSATDTGIIYSDIAYSPVCHWGLVFISDSQIGVDSGWFPNLERAFLDSFAASELKIWSLLKKDDAGKFQTIETDLTNDEAYAKRNTLTPISDYRVEPRTGYRW